MPIYLTTDNPGDRFSIGGTRVEYTVRDAQGNSETCAFTVTVTGKIQYIFLGVIHIKFYYLM